LGIFFLGSIHLYAQSTGAAPASAAADSLGSLKYPFNDQGAFDYPDEVEEEPLYLNRPANIERKIEYDPVSKQYVIYEKVGNLYYRMPKAMGLKEFVKYDFDQSVREYWRTRKETEELATGEKSSSLIPQLKIESQAFTNIFGSDVIDIRPQGYVEVEFGVKSTYNGNTSYPQRLRRNTNFVFDNQINMSVTGKIGDKVEMKVDYNTEATFDFENEVKLEYNGKEDEILRKIEAGNVSLPLNGTLIQGGTNLMGVKTEMQFGKLNLTTIVSQHKGESQVIETEGGAQKTKFEIRASEYDENRHFFISKYFRENYNKALSSLPTINTKVVVNKIEVWVTNKSQNFNESRDIIGFVDLGEQEGNISNTIPEFGFAGGQGYPANSVPHNGANQLYSQIINNYTGIRESKMIVKTMQSLVDRGFESDVFWQKIDQARRLNAGEYTLNKELGFISLNSALNNDEVLAVAYNITIGDTTFQVGEFSTDSENSKQTLVLKLLKGTTLSPNYPTWDLMMKNVYNIGAYDLSGDDFEFHVVYKNDSTTTLLTTLPVEEMNNTTLLRVMNLDNLNSQLDYTKGGDGLFDFIDGVTVLKSSGRIIFPVLEPFGSNIANKLSSQVNKDKYAFTSLYTKTKVEAQRVDVNHDKFYMVGSFKGSSGSEISLNTFNLAPGSVIVYAGSTKLVENVDYTVDYAMGKVKIINESYISAGTPIKVSTESQDLISMQRKTLVGTYGSYAFSDNLNIGGTFMYMNERPMTNKVDVGEEPVSNMMLGLDFQYRKQSQFLTDVVNLLPFYESKTLSSISFEGEVAKLFALSSSTTDNNVYIDDFEGVESSSSIINAYGWELASTPQGQSRFLESKLVDDRAYGYNRAKLSWYHIDRLFTGTSGSSMPAHIKGDLDMRSNHYMRSVGINEIFPGRELPTGSVTYQTVLDLSYFPTEKGPYNYDALPSDYSAGIDSDGKLKNPESRWAGVMREIQSPNFESNNIEYIEFWLLDPFIYDNGTHKGGDLFFNLGNISEDVLKDSYKSFENGLPENAEVIDVDTTVWGRVSTSQLLKQSFTSSTEESRNYQDVGFDGLNDEAEQQFFADYLDQLKGIMNQDAYDKVFSDPSSDNFHYYKGNDYDQAKLDIIQRYKAYNGLDGNSPVNTDNSSSADPDIEDINRDNTMNETEAYYQYRVSMRPEDFEVGRNHIVDKITAFPKLVNNNKEPVTWYQFKVPVKQYDEKIGSISDFKSIRFVRMFLTGFSDSITLRFGTLAFVKSEWIKEINDLAQDGTVANPETKFDMTSVNIEENASKEPINYILPPGIEREVDPTSTSMVKMNEQSMLLKVQELAPGDMKAVYKSAGIDMRRNKKLKMEVHAEAIEDSPLADYEVSLVVRLGSDYENYYEYEIPLKVTPTKPTSYDGSELYSADRYAVWPEDNRLDVNLNIFPQLKEKRDAAMRRAGSNVTNRTIYEMADSDSPKGKNIIRVKGNPSIGEVEIIHIGIRNPKGKNTQNKSVEVWVNELRMSDVEEKGGWASNGRVNLRLADLGTVSLAGSTQSVGWGSINETSATRNLEDRYQYDFAANIELGKLFPEKAGVHLPVYYNYSNQISNPEYNPLSSDIKMNDAFSSIESPEEKEILKNIAQEVRTRESFTVNNVTIEPERKNSDRKPLPTDIENFSVSYSYAQEFSHDVDVEKEIDRRYKASFDYNYSISSKYIEPFKKVKFLDNDFLRIIKDFNVSFLPELISFRTDMQKDYFQRQARDNSGFNIQMPVTVSKDFLWNRQFDIRWNLTRNLKIDFSNRNINRIDQMDGIEDRELYPELYNEIRQELWAQIQGFGRPVDYDHSIDVQYTFPINKLPLLDFTSLRGTYKGNYTWAAGPIVDETLYPEDLGNTAANGMNINLTGQLTLTTLYNKVPFLKNINQKYGSSTRRYGSRGRAEQNRRREETQNSQSTGKTKQVSFKEEKVSLKANVPKSIFHKLGTEKVNVVVLGEKGDTIKGTSVVVNENRINFKSATDETNVTVTIRGTIENVESFGQKALERTVRFLTGIQSARVSYTNSGGTEMPGFLGEPQAFRFGSQQLALPGGGLSLAPGVPFLLGWQDENFALIAANKGWISKDTTTLKQFLSQSTETWNLGLTFEPFANFRIEFSGTRRESSNISSFVQYNSTKGAFEQFSRKETGNFDMSVLTIGTAFREGLGDPNSELFNKFKNENRQIIQRRLNEQRGFVAGVGYSKSTVPGDTTNGISLNSSDVVIPALLATYCGIDASKMPLTARPGISWIRPNWRINYNGDPQNISWLKDKVTSLNFSHSYRSTYAVGNFETNLEYRPDQSGFSWVRSQLNQGENYFVPELDITAITIQENFSPLINLDVSFVNDFSASFQISKSRTMSFSFANMQLSEMKKNEFTVGVGYRFTGLDMIIKTKRKSEKVSNDVNMRLDISSSNYKTFFRKIDEKGLMQSGTHLYTIDFQSDYMVSDKLTLKLYYKFDFHDPHLKGGAEGYLQKNTEFGLSFNYAIM